MNDLYLIGNGFDLAHGLETSYHHFLLWYLKDSFQKCNSDGFFEDQLIKVSRDHYVWGNIKDYTSIVEILEDMKRMEFSIKYNHDFFKGIVENYRDYKWVDVEYEYYLALIKLYKQIENSADYSRVNLMRRLIVLNTCFDYIKKELDEYLATLKISSKQENREIESILLEGAGTERNGRGEKLYVYFNYTSTIELYRRNFFTRNNLIYIHGKLQDSTNPPIFGYGDEMDPYYKKIENLNSNEVLKNIKSFSYFKTDNYQRVIRFVEQGDFTVKVLGHSCGLSDRILLNTIFEHTNCKAIKIYYYEKSSTENDYFEKTQEISRHFRASMKGEMRKKIVSFENSTPMPQSKKNN